MSVYKLSNYLFVCEKDDFTGFGGCATELLIEQARGIKDAAEQAEAGGWYVAEPGQWDEPKAWTALCGYCANMRQVQVAKWQTKQQLPRT